MGSNWRTVLLSEALEISTKKVTAESVLIEEYISTENLLPGFGGCVCSSRREAISQRGHLAERHILWWVHTGPTPTGMGWFVTMVSPDQCIRVHRRGSVR